MIQIIKKYKLPFLILSFVVLFFVLTIANFQYTKTNQGGDDFLIYWTASRGLLLDGTSPYSEQITAEIQNAKNTSDNGILFTKFPLYSIVLFFPFALIKNFMLSRAIWMTVSESALIATIILCLRLFNWNIRKSIVFLFILFSLFLYHGVSAILSGNLIIILALFLVLLLITIKNHQDEVAGILLAFLILKPQSMIIVILFILSWAAINKRKKIVNWFLGTIVLIIGFSLVLLPDWIFQNIQIMIRFSASELFTSPGSFFIEKWGDMGQRLSISFTAIVSVLVLVEWWQARKANYKHLLWTVLLTVAMSQIIGIQTKPENYVLLYPSFFFGIGLLWERWKEKSLIWISGVMSFLFIGIWVIFILQRNPLSSNFHNFVLFILFPVFTIVLLYWSKWWVLGSKNVDFPQPKLSIEKR